MDYLTSKNVVLEWNFLFLVYIVTKFESLNSFFFIYNKTIAKRFSKYR